VARSRAGRCHPARLDLIRGDASSSAAIWLSTVCTPVPMSCTLPRLPNASRAQPDPAGAGEPEACPSSRWPCRGRHPRPFPARPLVPGAPAVAAAAPSSYASRGRPTTAGRRRRDLGEVGQPDVRAGQAARRRQSGSWRFPGPHRAPRPAPIGVRQRSRLTARPAGAPQAVHGVQRLAGLGGRSTCVSASAVC